MVVIVICGALCLGIVIGWLVRYFLQRLKEYNVQALASIVTILVGGTITKYLSPDSFNLGTYFYPVGLLVGILAYPLISRADGKLSATPARTPEKQVAACTQTPVEEGSDSTN